MAKRSMIERELKKAKLVEKYQAKRSELKLQVKKSNNYDERVELLAKLAKLPVNSNPVRHTKRCEQCGRPHAVYKKFGLCRICLREYLMNGQVPGGRKSSW